MYIKYGSTNKDSNKIQNLPGKVSNDIRPQPAPCNSELAKIIS